MDDRVLSGVTFVVLSAIFGGYALAALLAAYRAGNHRVWIEQAIQGGCGVVVSAFFADLVMRLFS
jgi:hypothetical protein